MTLTADQKNENILNRFETEESGSKISRFRVALDTHKMTVIDLNGMSYQTCVDMLNRKYQGRVVSVEQM